MKTYKDFAENTERRRTNIIYIPQRGFREQLVEDSWKKVLRGDEIKVGDIFGSADGLVRIKEIAGNSKKDCYYCSVVSPSHNQVSKNDIFSYSVDELFIGEKENPDDWELRMLRPDITDEPRHKKVDVINTKPMSENSIFQDGEKSTTTQLLNWLGLISGELINRNQKEIK